MHLLTILAFALVFWQAEAPGRLVLVAPDDCLITPAVVVGHLLVIGLTALWSVKRAAKLLAADPDSPERAQASYHRSVLAIRALAIVGFGAAVFLTRWPEWFAFGRVTPVLQILGDLIVLSPFFAAMVIVWTIGYPLERALRGEGEHSGLEPVKASRGWRFSSYLDFHVRHYLLVVAVPMTVILFAADLTRGYREVLQGWGGWVWAPDLVLGVAAAAVFVTSPLLLRRIWRTAPLAASPVRERLDALCRRIGLRCRDILVWDSGGLMINAAVMGIFAPVRYVILSDALLSTMSPRQIEAVFGHEAGHIRHHHMQYFLVFALVGWLAVVGIMELLACMMMSSDSVTELSLIVVEAVGVLATVVIWGVGFGWLSRRFERQADLFAARCATPSAGECRAPCGVHPDEDKVEAVDRRVCAAGAAVFASALDRVAVLNGIPHEERSWRHSSIGSRIRFLMALSGDASLIAGFERAVRRARLILVALAVVGGAACVGYWIIVREPAILRLQVGGP